MHPSLSFGSLTIGIVDGLENIFCTRGLFSNTNEKSVDTDFEAMEVSNDFPYPPKAETFIREGEIPRPKKIFSSQGSENVEVRRLGGIY